MIEDEGELARIVREAKTVVVLGMKDESEPDASAYEIPVVLQKHGMRVIPVNPKLTTALGEKAYRTIGAVPERADILDVFRRSEAIGMHVDEVLAMPPELRPRVFWMQTGVQNDAEAARLEKAGVPVVSDRCLGVYATRFRR
jgi:predicted CoA-binding protein